MKTTIVITRFVFAIMLALCTSGIMAQTSPTVKPDTIPPSAPVAPPAAPAAAATTTTPAPAPEAEKTKKEKDGFNSKSRFGIRVGGVISKQDYESSTVTEDPESKFGGDLAILYAIPIGGGFFMVQPEVHLMQKGYKIADTANGDVTSTLNYLEIPLLLRINFGGSLRLFAFAGPSVGFLLSGTYEDDTNVDVDPKDYLDDTEYSGHIGVGVGIGTFEVDLRYIAGLTDISDSANLQEVKNSSFGVGITLKF
jgi:Outer membrane protein beta-barrel domain